ncbi:bifunctional hydroxymethylpyrimidine kinase/phosphomethylpyrimidine kinase [Hydrocoleum sp. CS-953]|uniref:bifunctional hydroxymethylpyrimidine kinase/phosphomethylpyrimidine kinase n=2 Tax=Microcoleaceae TaxID=1892252 RepID=UPI00352BCBA1
MQLAAEKIYNLGVKTVLVKGGALKNNFRGADVWFDGERFEILRTATIETNNTHGTGCTLSAAIVANLAQGKDLFSAVKLAKDYVTNALKYALKIGHGQGPVAHFFPLLLNI